MSFLDFSETETNVAQIGLKVTVKARGKLVVLWCREWNQGLIRTEPRSQPLFFSEERATKELSQFILGSEMKT